MTVEIALKDFPLTDTYGNFDTDYAIAFLKKHEKTIRAALSHNVGGDEIDLNDLIRQIRNSADWSQNVCHANFVIKWLNDRGMIAAAPKAKPPEQRQVDTELEIDKSEAYAWVDAYEDIPAIDRDDWLKTYSRKAMRDLCAYLKTLRRYSELARGKGGKS